MDAYTSVKLYGFTNKNKNYLYTHEEQMINNNPKTKVTPKSYMAVCISSMLRLGLPHFEKKTLKSYKETTMKNKIYTKETNLNKLAAWETLTTTS
jgi:predicted component of type VI protein secretion system